MLELKTIIQDISNEYTMHPHQSKQLFDQIMRTMNQDMGSRSTDCMWYEEERE